MKNLFNLILITSLIQVPFIGVCQFDSSFSKERFITQNLDTVKINTLSESRKTVFNSLSYDEIAIGTKILLTPLLGNYIKENGIQIITKNKSEGMDTAMFNSHGHIIYNKYSSWTNGTTYKYSYSEDNLVDYVLMEKDTIQYIYNSSKQLIHCGDWVIKYYPNGFKKSVENGLEKEVYEYDINGNLIHSVFSFKTLGSHCGNYTKEWFGLYNKKNLLVEELRIGGTGLTLIQHTYNKNEMLINTKITKNLPLSVTNLKYKHFDSSIKITFKRN